MYQKFGFRNIAISGRGNPIMEYAVQPKMQYERGVTSGAPPVYRPTAAAQARPAVPGVGGTSLVYHPADFSSRGSGQIGVNRREYPQLGSPVAPVPVGVARCRGCLQLMEGPDPGDYPVNFYRNRKPPVEGGKLPISPQAIPYFSTTLGELNPSSIFGTLR
jgi:hypothetical protein